MKFSWYLYEKLLTVMSISETNSRLSWKNGIHQDNAEKLPFHSSKPAWRSFSAVCNARFLCVRSCIDIAVGFACRCISVVLIVLICFCACILLRIILIWLQKKSYLQIELMWINLPLQMNRKLVYDYCSEIKLMMKFLKIEKLVL